MANNLNRQAFKAGVWYTISNFVIRGLAFLTTPLFTRLITKEDYGLYSNFTSWLSLITIIATFDLHSSLQRAYFDYKEDIDSYISSVVSMSFLITLICYGVSVFFMPFFSTLFNMNPLYIHIMFLTILVSPGLQMIQVKHRFMMKYKLVTLLTFITAISCSTISVILVLLMRDDFAARVYGNFFPLVLINGSLVAYIFIKGKRINTAYWKYAAGISIPLVFHLIGGLIMNNTDRIFITKYCGAEYTALYSVVYSISMIVFLLNTSLNQAWNPWLFDCLNKNEYAPVRKYHKPFIAFYCAISIAVMLLAPEIVYIFGGEQYMQAIYIMPAIIMGLVCQFMYSLFVSTEIYHKKTTGIAVRTLTAGLVNLVLNIVFIPRFGYEAAAYTTLFSYFILMILHYHAARGLGVNVHYDIKFIFFATMLAFIIACLIFAVYKFTIARYICIGIYLVILTILSYKFRNWIGKGINALLERKVKRT